MNPSPLKPSTTLLCKLGSLVVHANEAAGPRSHAFDRIAIESLLRDPEVVNWLEGMRKLALLPVQR